MHGPLERKVPRNGIIAQEHTFASWHSDTTTMVADTIEANPTVATTSEANADKDNRNSGGSMTATEARNEGSPPSAPAVAGRNKTLGEELVDIKKILQQAIRRLERLKTSINDAGVGQSDETPVDVAHEGAEPQSSPREYPSRGGHAAGRRMPAFRTRPPRFPGRISYPRKPNWILKILDPHGLSPVDSLEEIEMASSTMKCLKDDDITELGYIEKNVLHKLIAGDDTVLQLRIKLENYAVYPLIDLLDKPSPDLQLVIIMNRLDAQSSRLFLSSLQKHMDTAEAVADVRIIPLDKKLDLQPLLKSSTKPTVFVTTPEMMDRLKNEGVIRSKSVLAMVVYEAEYVLRSPSNVDILRSALSDLEGCQVILACHDGTEDVLRSAEAFDFREEALIFSMDYTNVNFADHFYVTDSALVDAALDRAVKLSKTSLAVVMCHDGTEVNRLKDRFADSTEVITLAKAADSTLTSGLLITHQIGARVIQNKAHSSVKMIVNMSGWALAPDKYLEMLASYMDLGEQCEVVVKVGAQDALKSLEALGVSFKQYTVAEH